KTSKIIFLNLGQERLITDPKFFGCARLVSLVVGQCVGNLLSFDHLHRAICDVAQAAREIKTVGLRIANPIAAQAQIARLKFSRVSENTGTLDRVLQLAYIPRPTLPAQCLHTYIAQRGLAPA